MKYILILLVFCLIKIYGLAQTASIQEVERKIKTSNLYLYGESISDNQDEAISLAKKILVSKMIEFDPSLVNESNQVESVIMESKDFISMPRGIKFRAIAFILKTEVKGSSNLAMTNKGQETQQLQEQKTIENNESEEKKHLQEANPLQPEQIKSTKESQIAPELIAVSKVPPNVNEEVKHVSDLSSNKIENNNFRQNFSNGSELLQYILSVKDVSILSKLFEDQKHKGMLVYGGKNSMSFPDKCYIVFYSQEGSVKAYLDKGSQSRKNLITGELESIDKYKDILFIWFQIMN